eukprot:scaffold201_cov405-Prasinococcus_capsulatus_cf.AAC.4
MLSCFGKKLFHKAGSREKDDDVVEQLVRQSLDQANASFAQAQRSITNDTLMETIEDPQALKEIERRVQRSTAELSGLSNDNPGESPLADDNAAEPQGNVKGCISTSTEIRYMYATQTANVLSPSFTDTAMQKVLLEGACLDRDKNGLKHLNQYIIVKALGTGSTAVVKLCLNTRDNHLYAMKVIDKLYRKRTKAMLQEIAVMKKLKHENLVKLLEVIDDPQGTSTFMVLEYVDGGPVMTRSDKFPIAEEKCRLYFRGAVIGLDYLHYYGIAHRDIKPENILKTAEGTVKIADFGVSSVRDGATAKQPQIRTVLSRSNAVLRTGDSNEQESNGKIIVRNTAGTPGFLAPECLLPEPFDAIASDVWALGVTLYSMVYARLPFMSRTSRFEMYKMIKQDPVSFPEDVDTSENLKSLLREMLEKSPEKRITLKQIMAHDWVTNTGDEPLRPITASKPMSIQPSALEIDEAVRTDSLAAMFEPVWKERVYKDGEYLMKKGEEGAEMFFLNKGEVEILADAIDMDSQRSFDLETIAVRRMGEFVGEIALVGDEGVSNKRTASVRAKGVVEVLVVAKADLHEKLRNDPNVYAMMRRTVLARQR